MKELIKSELSGWKKLEVLWLAVATAIIAGVSIYSKDNAIGVIAALTGVWCVILTGKGKMSSFIVGTVNTVLYAYTAYKASLYGEVMLNMIYYVPMNFVGLFAWKKHMGEENNEVVKERLSLKQSAIVYPVIAIAVVGYGFVLQKMGGATPYIDSLSTVLSIFAQILCVKRLADQWALWICVNVVSVAMWVIQFVQTGENLVMIFMWGVYLVNAIIMFIKWEREAKNEV